MSRKFGAWLNLAWHFALHVTTRLWLRPFRGGKDLERFRKQVEPEGYVPMPAATRAEFPRYMGCVQCGLCAVACSSAQSSPASAWDEAWTFVTGASRSLDHVGLVAADLSACVETSSVEAVCPMGVPIVHMAQSIRAMGSR